MLRTYAILMQLDCRRSQTVLYLLRLVFGEWTDRRLDLVQIDTVDFSDFGVRGAVGEALDCAEGVDVVIGAEGTEEHE